MTRKPIVLLLLLLLTLSACRRHKDQTAAPATSTPAPAAAAGAPAPPPPPSTVPIPSKTALAAPPSKPDIALPPTTPAPAAKPQLDTAASVIALCYHNVEETTKSKALTVSTTEFEKQMQQLKDNGFSVIGMQDYLAYRRGEKNIPHKCALVTLDDGWVSAYTTAWPILKKFNYPFTLFIYINYIGTGGKSLSWEQLAEMRDAKVDIQSHTFSHSNLHGKGALVTKKAQQEIATMGYVPWLKHEIIGSKEELEKQLGIKCNVFAYPYGKWNADTREVIKQGGFEAAFTVYGQRLGMKSPASDQLGRYAIDNAQPKNFPDALAMIGGGTGGEAAAPSLPQFSSTALITQPGNNETVNSVTPLLKANLATFGEGISNVELRLSGVGPLPVQYNAQTKLMTSQVAQKLKPGSTYTAIVSATAGGQRAEYRWNFTVSPSAGTAAPAPPSPPQF